MAKLDETRNYRKNREKHQTTDRDCPLYNENKIQVMNSNSDLLKAKECWKRMIKDWINRYYMGLFSLKTKDDEHSELLEYAFYRFINDGQVGILKIGNEYNIVNVNVSERDSSYRPLSATIQGKDLQGNPLYYYLSKRSEVDKVAYLKAVNSKEKANYVLWDWKDLVILEMFDIKSVHSYISPLLTLSHSAFESLMKSVGLSNMGVLIGVDPKNYRNNVEAILNITHSWDGLIGIIKITDGIDFKQVQLTNKSPADVTGGLQNLASIINLIRQFMGMRYNENYMSNRNIKLGQIQSQIVFSFFEKPIADALERFVKKINSQFNWDVTFVKNLTIEAVTPTPIDNNLKLRTKNQKKEETNETK